MIIGNINEEESKNIIKKLNFNPNNFQNGIMLSGDKKEKILEFINVNSYGEFNMDKEGKLIITKEESGNPIDEELKIQLEKRNNIIITMSSLRDEEYTRIILDNNYRIIILNKKYYDISSGKKIILDTHDKEIKTEVNNLSNEELSDRLVKSLYLTKNYKNKSNSLKSSTSTVGIMAQNQVVYHGPSTSYYASVGSVDQNEQVYILSSAFGFYHIQYQVGSTGKQKQGYVPQTSIQSYTGTTPQEEDYYGGYCYASENATVYTCDDFSLSYQSSHGSLFQYEGCTMIFHYNSYIPFYVRHWCCILHIFG